MCSLSLSPHTKDDEQKDYQKVVSENIQQRLEKACEELKERHLNGTNQVDDPDRAPTGDPYRMMQHQSNQREKERHMQAQMEHQQQMEQLKNRINENTISRQDGDTKSSNDEDWLEDDDDDPVLEAIRQARLNELKAKQIQHAENMAKGHGQYRTISQDEFLPECTGTSEWVVVHFFHQEFERCNIMDHHVAQIAPHHTECKFLRINAEKAPFFVAKLQITILPTLIVFQNGKVIGRLTGFKGLVAKDPTKPDEWHTTRLQEWLSSTGAIEYTAVKVPTEEIREEMDRLGLMHSARGAAIWSESVAYNEDG